MTSNRPTPVIINGWAIYAHPLFLDRLENLCDRVDRLKIKYPAKDTQKNITKQRDAIIIKAFKEIPEDPTRIIYRQGNTLGEDYKSWFRAKFFQQYRLFFRFNLERKIIIYGWVNDSKTLRAYGSKTNAYAVYFKMLNDGNPPTDWHDLLSQSQNSSGRIKKIIE